MVVTVRRAIKEDQKLERYQAILQAALDLFEITDYQNITLEAVAQRVGLARATLYRYFKTREALFLAVLEQLYQHWYDYLNNTLQCLLTERELAPIEEVSNLLCGSLQKFWTLARLSALSATILEQNVDFESADHFKRNLLAASLPTANLLEQALPFLDKGQGLRLLMRLQILLIGLQSVSNPAPIVRQVYEQSDLQHLKTNFEEEFSILLTDWLYGIKYQKDLLP